MSFSKSVILYRGHTPFFLFSSQDWKTSKGRTSCLPVAWPPYSFISFAFPVAEFAVPYDRKAIVINGQRRILISGSMHYARSIPDMWVGLIQKAKDGGLDVIQTYVFWNGHEPSPGPYNFKGRTQFNYG